MICFFMHELFVAMQQMMSLWYEFTFDNRLGNKISVMLSPGDQITVQRFPGTESEDELVILQSCFFPYATEESARKQYIMRLFQRRQNRLENNNICVIVLFQRQNLLENIFPSQWKTEFLSYFCQKLLESARKKKNNYIKYYF